MTKNPYALNVKPIKLKPISLGGIDLGESQQQRDSKRSFGQTLQKRTYDSQDGHCYKCKRKLKVSHMEFHHIKSWSKGGKSTSDNCIGLCHECHKDIHDKERIKDSDKKSRSKGNNGGLFFGGNNWSPPRGGILG